MIGDNNPIVILAFIALGRFWMRRVMGRLQMQGG